MKQNNHRHRRQLLWTAVLLCTLLLAPLRANAKEVSLIYTLRLTALQPEVVSAIHTEAPVIDRVGKYQIGRVLSLSHAPHMTERYSEKDGCMKRVPHPTLVDVTVTLRTAGQLTDSGCRIGGYRLTEGGSVSFLTPLFAGVGECIAIMQEEVSAP